MITPAVSVRRGRPCDDDLERSCEQLCGPVAERGEVWRAPVLVQVLLGAPALHEDEASGVLDIDAEVVLQASGLRAGRSDEGLELQGELVLLARSRGDNGDDREVAARVVRCRLVCRHTLSCLEFC